MALTDNLAAYWRLDEASGTRFDSAGTNHLTDINTVGTVAGKQGGAAVFVEANSERLECADTPALSLGSSDLSIAAWIYLTGFTGQAYLLSKFGGGFGEYLLQYDGTANRFVFDVYGTGGSSHIQADTFGAPAFSAWHFVVARFTLSTWQATLTVNAGTEDLGTIGSGTPNDTTRAFALGAISGGGGYWSGRMDEVGVWKRVLTNTEVTQLYNGGAGMTITVQSQAPRSMHRRHLVAV